MCLFWVLVFLAIVFLIAAIGKPIIELLICYLVYKCIVYLKDNDYITKKNIITLLKIIGILILSYAAFINGYHFAEWLLK